MISDPAPVSGSYSVEVVMLSLNWDPNAPANPIFGYEVYVSVNGVESKLMEGVLSDAYRMNAPDTYATVDFNWL